MEASDAVCVCGHAKAEHDPQDRGVGCLGEHCHCRCTQFQESLPWPNEEGNWWCSLPMLSDRTIHAAEHEGEFMIGYEGTFDWCPRKDFETLLGPARFTRVLEQNPFPE